MSMRDYRNPPWVSAPSYMVPPQYVPPPYPQSIFPIEQAIINLTKLVGDVVEEQKKFNAQLSKKFHTVETSLNQRIDGLQSEMEHKFNNLQYSISKLASQQHAHQEGENPEGECLSDTMVEEQCQQQRLSESSYICAAVCPWEKKEETSPMLTEEGSGKEEIKKPQRSTAQAINNPLPEAPSPDLVYTLPAAQPTPEAPTTKATQFAMPALQNFKTLVAIVQTFVTTSKTLTTAHIARHSGWFGVLVQIWSTRTSAFLISTSSSSTT